MVDQIHDEGKLLLCSSPNQRSLTTPTVTCETESESVILVRPLLQLGKENRASESQSQDESESGRVN